MVGCFRRKPASGRGTVNTAELVADVRFGIQLQAAVCITGIQGKIEGPVIAGWECTIVTVHIKREIFHRVVLCPNIAELITAA